MSDVITVQRLVPAPPERIFDLLADPDGHAQIDGGGTVLGARSGGRRLALGDRFGMDMHLGVAYSTRNTVIELEENRRVDTHRSIERVLGRKVDDTLVTLLWVLYSPETYRKLVVDSGLSRDEYEALLVEASNRLNPG